MRAAKPTYRYRVDAEDRIVWVDPLWLAFARENSAVDLDERRVLGRLLWSFISDESTRQAYQQLHRLVRASGDPVVVPFRCDSPNLKRHMRLKISRQPGDQLAYDSALLRVEPQARVALLADVKPRSDSHIAMCSFCKRCLLESVGWLEPGLLLARLHAVRSLAAPRVTYTLCPDCSREASV